LAGRAQMLVRRAKNRYTWIGFGGVPAALAELKVRRIRIFCSYHRVIVCFVRRNQIGISMYLLNFLLFRFGQEMSLRAVSSVASPSLDETSAANVRFILSSLLALGIVTNRRND
jgi:hypothetical protein